MAKGRVLAVDDEPYFRVFLEDLLGATGYEVRTAAGADEALGLLEREAFDVVLTDLVMPGLSGSELVERVKARWPEQDVVVVTSVGDVRTAVDAMRRGATDYLVKPIDRSLLERSVESIVQRRRLSREHEALVAENLEYLGVLSLYERTLGLFSTLALQPLAERIVEGLCLETRAQGGVAWVAGASDSKRFRLASGRGLVRLDREPEEIGLDALPPGLEPLGDAGCGVFLLSEGESQQAGRRAMVVPLRRGEALLGFIRLTDKLSGETFDESDRAAAERFAEPAAIAVANALRHHELERRTFRDPVTKAYTWTYFEDLVRNELQKASRFGRAFSVVKLELEGVGARRERVPEPEFARWLGALVSRLGGVLRGTDLLAEDSESRYGMLLPETDALGAAVLKRRAREALRQFDSGGAAEDEEPLKVYVAAASYPVDGTQLDVLERVLAERLAEDRTSLVHALGLGGKPLAAILKALSSRASSYRHGAIEQIIRFVLDEVDRRKAERGLLALALGSERVGLVRDTLARLDAAAATEVVLVSDLSPRSLAGAPLTCVSPGRLGTDRLFLIYCAEGPRYALVEDPQAPSGEVRLFHTNDRGLVEDLAFGLKRELGMAVS